MRFMFYLAYRTLLPDTPTGHSYRTLLPDTPTRTLRAWRPARARRFPPTLRPITKTDSHYSYDGEVGAYMGDVGEYAGDVGEYAGDVGKYAGDVGEYMGDV
jgi:hypothetical protein